MILLSQWYEPDDADRLAELKSVRQANESSGLFDEVVYLEAKDKRLSFGDFFEHAETHYRDEVCAIANSDILFDSTSALIPPSCKQGRLLTLTRWEPPYLTPRFLGHSLGEKFFSGSQDVWAFVAGGLPHLTEKVPLGFVACDQIIVGWAAMSQCEVINPCLTIKTMHVHRDTKRNFGGTMYGWFGYPEPTIVADKYEGFVMVHKWPQEDARKKLSAFPTCQP